MFENLSRDDRMLLLRFVCAFAWTDLEIHQGERQFVERLIGRMELSADDRAEALSYLQSGFDAHYAEGGATDDDVLVGDNAYALAVETIARLDEPRFVAVASRMIRDGAGRIAAARQ